MKTPPPSKPASAFDPLQYLEDHVRRTSPDLFESIQARMNDPETEGGPSKKPAPPADFPLSPARQAELDLHLALEGPSKKNEASIPSDPHPFRREWTARRDWPESEEFPITIFPSKKGPSK